MTWQVFEVAAPHLAELGRERLERQGIALLGTLRRDGSPRISVIEPHIASGHLLFGVMRSAKRLDLERDPRCTLHSPVTNPKGSEGEFKIQGRARLVADPALRAQGAAAWWQAFPADAASVYSMDIESATFVDWDVPRGEISIEEWTPARGVRTLRRPYP